MSTWLDEALGKESLAVVELIVGEALRGFALGLTGSGVALL